MNIGAIIFLCAGIAFIVALPKIFKKKSSDYTKYPITTGTVMYTEDFSGSRWTVEFNVDGKEVLGMDDRLAANTFKPKKFLLPKCGTQEKFIIGNIQGTLLII